VRGQPIRFVDFRGGLNTKSAPYLVAENECRNCQNIVSTVRGSIKKRNGCTTFCSTFTGTPAGITSLFGLNVGATVLIAAGGTKLYSISTGGVATDITGAASLTSGAHWEFSSGPTSGGQGPLYGINGTEVPKYWSGTGNIADWTATVGSIPNGKYITYTANRIWVAGVASTPSRLFFSDLGDPRSWTATNVVDLDPNDGQSITAIARMGAYLLVFKQTKCFIIYDLNTGANRALSTNVGCVASRSVAEGPEGIYFLSADQGVFVATPSKLTNVSDNILSTLDALSPSLRSDAAGAFINNHYYLSCGSASAARNDMTLDYDTTTQSWWKHTNTASQFALWRPSASGEVELYAAQASAIPIVDKCYVDNVFQDNGVNFRAAWYGPWLAYKEPYRRKRVRQLHVDGTGTVDVYYSTDFLPAMNLIGSNIFSGTSGVSTGTTFGDASTYGSGGVFGDAFPQGQDRIFSLGVARAFSFEFESVASDDMEIDAYTTLITPRTN
jgi:hypothetical protein